MSRLPILIVDDEPLACGMLARLLSAYDHQVDTAQDGATALELVQRNVYGLAIIDYSMPGMNGVELFRKMRALRPNLDGVFLTGYTTIDVVYPAIEAGILHVLPKPADFRELIAIVEEQIGAAA